MDLPLIVSASIAIGHLIRRFLPDPIVKGLLFDGEIEAGHKTKFALQQYVERYKDSVGTMNVCFTLNVAFAVLALYAYFGLADGSTIKIPFIDLSISRKQWITLCPIISYGLQA